NDQRAACQSPRLERPRLAQASTFSTASAWKTGSHQTGELSARPRSLLPALQQVADFREQQLLLGQYRSLRLGVYDLVHQSHDEKQNPSDDDEVDDDGEEIAPR